MDKAKTTTSSSNSSWMYYSIVAVLVSACFVYSPFSLNDNDSKYSILNLFARDAMAWNISTTPIPISSPSVILKSILSKDVSSVPEELKHLMDQDTVQIQQVRDYLNRQRYQHLLELCSGSNLPHCQQIINTPDPEFGLTPLHLALSYGDTQTASFLLSLGANPDLLDSVGRKPQNMSFSSFIANSKRWNMGRNCDIPTVTVRSSDDFAEVRRLISEGEPVLMKGAMHHLRNAADLAALSLSDLVTRYGQSRVTVGEVPYADVFKLKHSISNLKDYYTQHVLTKSSAPLYIFQKNGNVTKEGLDGLSDLVKRAFPIMICPVEYGQTGVDSIHFYLGGNNSGAPFHIHADAINLVVNGQKHWFMYPPIQAIYSRKHISRWIEEDYVNLKEEEKPLECIQEAGDIIYVPFDWGHAVLNTAEQTFGYALELLNRREVFASLPEMYQNCK